MKMRFAWPSNCLLFRWAGYRAISITFLIFLLASSSQVKGDSFPTWAWWPEQTLPKGLVECPQDLYEHPGPGITPKTQTVLVESLAGLAAQAVNENHYDELVWVDPGEGSSPYDQWLSAFKARTKVEDRGSLSPWSLATRLTKAGLVKGYILYSPDPSMDQKLTEPKTINESLNVATTAAGVLRGILVTPEMEETAKSLGLTLLLDARGKSESWAFNQFKDKLNGHYLLMQNSRLVQNRDIAIAHRIATIYTIESPYPQILAWMEPMGMVFGWYGGSEDQSVGQASKSGQVLVASDYTWNLPVLSAGRAALDVSLPPPDPIDPARIERAAAGNSMAFMLSDGDNLQWLMGDFITQKKFWASPDRAKIPFGWTLCPGDLDLMAPDALTYLWHTKPNSASFVAHAGYFYPDLFAQNFDPNRRRELLKQLALRIGDMMQATHVHLLTFLCMELDSDATRESCQIFARNIPDLVGVFPIQFDPYEEGGGKVFWEPDGNGGNVPFITARYSLWADVDEGRPHAGTPLHVAQIISSDAKNALAKNQPLAAWILVHAWSGFAPEEDPAQGSGVPNDRLPDALIGPSAAALCARGLSPDVTVVNPQELAWIERWQHDPDQTRTLLQTQK